MRLFHCKAAGNKNSLEATGKQNEARTGLMRLSAHGEPARIGKARFVVCLFSGIYKRFFCDFFSRAYIAYLISGALFFISSHLFAQQPVVMEWPLTGMEQVAKPNSFSSLGFNTGKSVDSLQFTEEFGATTTGWNTDNPDPEAYYEYTVTPAPGRSIEITRLNFEVSLSRVNMRTSVQYSYDGFRQQKVQIGHTIYVGTPMPRNLPVKTSLRVTYPQTLTIRVFGWSTVDHRVSFHNRNVVFEGVVFGKDLLVNTPGDTLPYLTTAPEIEPKLSEFSDKSREISKGPLGTITLSANITPVDCYGNNNGAINLTINYTAPILSIAWTGPSSFIANTEDISNLYAGTYIVTVTDTEGGTATESYPVNEPAVLIASTSATAILCNGGNSTVTVTASGGTAPYTGTGTFTVTAGTYNYTVMDANGCTASTSITISQPSQLIASSTSTPILCNGGSSTATVTATGGTAPYTGTGSFTVTAGTYNYTVTDANGCTANASITVTQPEPLVASSTATAILCNGGNSTVTVSASGGTAPYTGTGTFTVTAGTHNYTVTDANGCTANTSVTITEPPILSIAASSNSPICQGSTLNLNSSPAGGTPNYTFSWSGPFSFTSTVQNPSIGNAQPAASGAYTVVVVDANGCTASANTNVTVHPTPTVDNPGNQAVCNNAATTAITFTGAVSSTTYNWTNNTTSIGLAASGTGNIASFTATNTGTTNVVATITVTPSANGCVGAPVSFTITVRPTPNVIDPSDQTVCNGSSTNPVNFSGNVTGTIYNWTNNTPSIGLAVSGTGNIPAFTANATGTAPITATIIVTPSYEGCPGTPQSFTITVRPTPVVTISGTITVCRGSSPPPVITFTNPHPLAVIVTYNINGGAPQTINIAANSNITLIQATNVAGAYNYNLVSVQYQSTPNCPNNSINGTATITVLPTPTATISGTSSVCQNGAEPTITFTNPQALPITVTYSINGVNQPPINIGANNVATVNAPTNVPGTFVYNLVSVSFQGGNACTSNSSGSATITVKPTPTITISGDQTVCQNTSPSPNFLVTNPQTTSVQITYTINGGAPIYQNIPANTTFPIPVNTSVPNTYVYNVTQVQYQNTPSCPNPVNLTATVTVLQTPTVSISGTTTVCQNDTQPQITFTNTQPTPITVEYNINGTNQTPVSVGANSSQSVSASTLNPGVFVYNLVSVSYQGSISCSNNVTGSATITVRPTPTASIGGGGTFCQYTSPSPNITITNPQANAVIVTYTINGGAPVSQSIPANTTYAVPVNANIPNTYNFALVSIQYQTAPSCLTPVTGTATVTILSIPTVLITGSTSVCQNSAEPEITITNTQALPVTVIYNINGANQTSLDINANSSETIYASTLLAGTFVYNIVSVAYQGGTGCTNSSISNYVTITVYPQPTAISPGDQTFCIAAPTPVIPLTGSPAGVLFDITGGTSIGLANQTDVTAIPSFTPIAGTAIINIKPKANGCTGNITTFSITIYNLPILTCPNPISVCLSNPPFSPGATPVGGTYSGTGIVGNQFDPAIAGVGVHQITYTYSDGNGCQNTCTFPITVNPIPTGTYTQISICSGETTNIDLNALLNPPITGATFTWTAAQLSGQAIAGYSGCATSCPTVIAQTLTNGSNPGSGNPGTIRYRVTPSANGCQGTPFNIDVTVNPVPMLLNATFHQQHINDPEYDYIQICDGESIYYAADNDLEVFYWNNGIWRFPTYPFFESYDWGWEYAIGSPAGPWLPANDLGTITNNYEFVMPDPPSIFSSIGDYYFRFFITNSYGCTSYTDILHLEVSSTLQMEVGEPITATCSSNPTAIPLTGASIGGTPNPQARWSITSLDPPNGANMGTLSSTNWTTTPSNITYTPPANYIGTVVLTLTSNDPPGICNALHEIRTITILPVATAIAGNSETVCAGTSVQLHGTLFGNASGATWSALPAGSGTFSNINDLDAIFTPTIPSGTITLTLTPNITGSCVISSSLVITVNPAPTTSGVEICIGGTGSLLSTSYCPSSSLTTTDYRAPGYVSTYGAGDTWQNPTYVGYNDNYYTRCYVGWNSENLYVYNFGFTAAEIPTGATINGITVIMGKYAQRNRMFDESVRLFVGGAVAGDNKAIASPDWDRSEQTSIYGSANDTWGLTLTPAQIYDTDFGVVVNVRNDHPTLYNYAYIDYIQVSISYSVDGNVNWYTTSTGGSPIGYGSPFNPVGVAGSGLPNTNTPGTYTFYAECTSYSGCRTATDFIIQPGPTVTQPDDYTSSACNFTNQAELDTEFANWLAEFSVSGGDDPQGSFTGTPAPPQLCNGGTVSVTFNYTDFCASGSVTRTFTINPPPALSILHPNDAEYTACDFANQAAVDAAFATWLAGFSVTGGCNPQATFGGSTPVAPALCGGSVTVTYNVTDLCETGSESATFTINDASNVVLSSPGNVTYSTCDFQNQSEVNAAFNNWLTGFTTSGGCSTASYGNPTAPLLCSGGTTEVTYLYSDICTTTSESASFTLTAPSSLVLEKPADFIASSCNFNNQNELDAAFALWLNDFNVSGGCSPDVSFLGGTPVAPLLCNGGTIIATYTVSDICEITSVSALFQINPPPSIYINKPLDFTSQPCEYSSQEDLNDVFANWLTAFYVSGGCNPTGGFSGNTPVAPDICAGGTVTATFDVTDLCSSGSVSSSFTVMPANNLIVNYPSNSLESSCQTQQVIDALFSQWIAEFNYSGGCSPTSTDLTAYTAPDACGGSVSITYTVEDECNPAVTITRTFTVENSEPLVITCPEDAIEDACQTQNDIDTQFATWLNTFNFTGGCTVTATDLSALTAPDACGGSISINYTVYDNCGQADNCYASFTVLDTPVDIITCPDPNFVEVDADTGESFASDVPVPTPETPAGCSTITLSWSAPDATPASGTGPFPATNQFPVGTTTITWTASDGCGNVANCTFTVTVNPNDPPDITCAPTVTQDATDDLCSAVVNPTEPTVNAGAPVTWSWEMTGAVTVSGTGAIDDYTFPVGTTTITWTATNASGTATCTQDIVIEDHQPPTFTAPGPLNQCVISIISAVYDGAPGIDADIFPIDPDDGNPRRPDWYLVASGSNELNITNILDNCCDLEDITISWTITFDPLIGGTLSGTGQPSLSTPIQLWGIHTNVEVNHTITYTVTDCNGNAAEPVSVNILIRPRPNVIKQ